LPEYTWKTAKMLKNAQFDSSPDTIAVMGNTKVKKGDSIEYAEHSAKKGKTYVRTTGGNGVKEGWVTTSKLQLPAPPLNPSLSPIHRQMLWDGNMKDIVLNEAADHTALYNSFTAIATLCADGEKDIAVWKKHVTKTSAVKLVGSSVTLGLGVASCVATGGLAAIGIALVAMAVMNTGVGFAHDGAKGRLSRAQQFAHTNKSAFASYTGKTEGAVDTALAVAGDEAIAAFFVVTTTGNAIRTNMMSLTAGGLGSAVASGAGMGFAAYDLYSVITTDPTWIWKLHDWKGLYQVLQNDYEKAFEKLVYWKSLDREVDEEGQSKYEFARQVAQEIQGLLDSIEALMKAIPADQITSANA